MCPIHTFSDKWCEQKTEENRFDNGLKMETSQKGRNMRLRISLITKICHPSLVLLGMAMIAGPAAATEFTFGEVNMSLGTTVSAAASIRTDRKSDVWGKSGQIRVERGGCR